MSVKRVKIVFAAAPDNCCPIIILVSIIKSGKISVGWIVEKLFKIFVKDEIADELWDNEKLYNKIKNISDGIYDPVYDDYELLLFKNI